MNTLRTLLCLLVLAPMPAFAQTSPSHSTRDHAILAVLNKSADDWNRGDLDAFAASYKNSPDILFVSRTITRGYAQMLARYKASYPTPEKMGKLTFSQLEVQPLDQRLATVTGHFHLDRTVAGGGNADGYFLLVLENTPAGWKVVRDDTTALPPPPSK
ncbi:MAG TPA: nuclear transport factor 2 family protein [Acidobacteriaceae bacterium]